MARYIDADLLLQRLTGAHSSIELANNYYAIVYQMVRNMPTSDVEEVKHGKWVAYPHNSGIYCSECRHKRRYKDMNDKFCPNCGAKMDAERKETT